MLSEDSDHKIYFLGAIGESDQRGRCIRDAAAKSGVEPLFKLMPKDLVPEGTGVCAVLVDEKSRDRSLICMRGASVGMSQDRLQEEDVRLALRNVSCIYLVAFTLTTANRFEVAEQLATLELSKERAIIALNLSSAAIQQRIAEQIRSILPRVHLVFCNAKELHAWFMVNYAQANYSHKAAAAACSSVSGLVPVALL